MYLLNTEKKYINMYLTQSIYQTTCLVQIRKIMCTYLALCQYIILFVSNKLYFQPNSKTSPLILFYSLNIPADDNFK